MLPLVLWLAAGAAVGGLVGWGGATTSAAVATPVGVGFGFAIGGGIGAVIKLLVVDEQEPEPPESVAVTMGNEGQDTPDPQPVDLFDAHPDPLIYYEDRGDGPVVRAVNAAFVDRFGVSASAVEDAGLGDALMVAGGGKALVEAAADGLAFDDTVECETGEGTVLFRTRVIADTDDAGTRGYVLYSPVTAGE